MAIARPWIFAELADNLSTDPEIFLEAASRLAKLLNVHYQPIEAIKRFRRFAFYFSANFQFGHTFYSGILNARDMKEAQTVLCRFFEKPPGLGSRPNMNFFK
jgi:hypothetical protein